MLSDKIDKKIQDNKKNIYIISPSYWLYDSLKIGAEGEENIRKTINSKLANLMKYFYLSLSIFIFSLFSMYDARNRIIEILKVKQVHLLLLLIYIGLIVIITIGIPLVLVRYFLNKSKAAFEDISQHINENSKLKFYMFKYIKCIYILILVCYLSIILSGNKLGYIKPIGIIIIILFFGVSRPIHFALVFIKEVVKKFEIDKKMDKSRKLRLIVLCMASYLNLIIDYSILFYSLKILNNKYLGNITIFENDIKSIWDMIYFTVRNGDLVANNYIGRIFIIIMISSITILITGVLAAYLNIEENSDIN